MPAGRTAGAPLAQWSAAGYLTRRHPGRSPASSTRWQRRALPMRWTSRFPWRLCGRPVIDPWAADACSACWGAAGLLTAFYLSAIPTTGVPVTGQEGTYLIVSKNLIELGAVLVLLAFHTDRIAGLDLLWSSRAQSKTRCRRRHPLERRHSVITDLTRRRFVQLLALVQRCATGAPARGITGARARSNRSPTRCRGDDAAALAALV